MLGTIRRIVEEANELAAAHQLLEDDDNDDDDANNNNDDDAAAVVVDDGPHNLWESAAPAPEEEVYASSCTAKMAKPRERDCDLDSLSTTPASLTPFVSSGTTTMDCFVHTRKEIAPGGSCCQQTYVTHPWTFKVRPMRQTPPPPLTVQQQAGR